MVPARPRSSLAALGFSVTAVEPGAGMAALARQRLGSFDNVQVETSTFEEWDDQGRRFELLLAAASWHWVDPSIGWPRAHAVLRPGGWMSLIGNVVVRRPGEPEVYAETADLHERYCPGNPDWGHPPLEDEVRATNQGWGLVEDPGSLFGPTTVRWYPVAQWFDGAGFADLLRSTSLYRRPRTRSSRAPSQLHRRADPSTHGGPSASPLPGRPPGWSACRLTAEIRLKAGLTWQPGRRVRERLLGTLCLGRPRNLP